MKVRAAWVLGLGLLAFGMTPSSSWAQDEEPSDAVSRLQERMDRGEVEFAFDSLLGWLPSVLSELEVPISSQGLVFSRTSLQTDRIAPWAPRAVYFNDEVYIGFVQDGGVLELAVVNSAGGAAFYTMPQLPMDNPRFRRESTTCLMCHESRSLTGGVPGFIVRSVLTDRLGYPITEVHTGLTTERTPFEDRFGGWYVTDEGAGMGHAGNRSSTSLRHEVADVDRYLSEFDFESRVGLPGERFDASVYPSPHSDVVALTLLLHQVRLHNLIAGAHEAGRQALREMGLLGLADIDSLSYEDLHPAGRVRVDGAIQRLVDAMVFTREVPPVAPLVSTSGFAEEFQARGPFDSDGRSLRDLDLSSRTFRYPLSFLIYSDAFDALPDLTKDRVYALLSRVLHGEAGDAYDHLSAEDRTAILEILADTKPDFPQDAAAGS